MKIKILSINVLFFLLITNLVTAMEPDEKALKDVFFRSSYLALSSRGLSDDYVCNLANIIEGSPYITQLELNHNSFGDVGVKALANKLTTIPNLTHLHLYGAHITDSGFSDLFNAIEQCQKIIFIDLRETLISDMGIIMLSDLCSINPKLTFHSSFKNISQDLLAKVLGKGAEMKK